MTSRSSICAFLAVLVVNSASTRQSGLGPHKSIVEVKTAVECLHEEDDELTRELKHAWVFRVSLENGHQFASRRERSTIQGYWNKKGMRFSKPEAVQMQEIAEMVAVLNPCLCRVRLR